MYRFAFAALLLTSTSAFAGDQAKGAHTHIGAHEIEGASFTAPINYRQNNSRNFVRTRAYNEANTKSFGVCQGWVFSKCDSPLLETAQGSSDPTRSVISVEEF